MSETESSEPGLMKRRNTTIDVERLDMNYARIVQLASSRRIRPGRLPAILLQTAFEHRIKYWIDQASRHIQSGVAASFCRHAPTLAAIQTADSNSFQVIRQGLCEVVHQKPAVL